MSTQPRVISFHYTLWNKSGEVLDQSEKGTPLVFLEGSGQIIEGLEEALGAMKVGQKQKVEVPAKRAYGERDQELMYKVPVEQFPEKSLKPGDMFQSNDESDHSVYTVVAVTPTHVEIDGNHPLAGEDLTFEVEIAEIRAASPQELSHGHAHGAHGHDH